MQIGVTFPQNEISADPSAVRDYVRAAEEFGYQHLIIYDHVLGADPANRPGWQQKLIFSVAASSASVWAWAGIPWSTRGST